MAGTTAAQNQPTHVSSIPRPSLANVAHSGLAVIPVMNIAPVIGVNWKQVIVRNSPRRFCLGPGSESKT